MAIIMTTPVIIMINCLVIILVIIRVIIMINCLIIIVTVDRFLYAKDSCREDRDILIG